MYILIPLLAVLVLLLLATGGISWYVANKLLKRESGSPSFTILVTEQNDETITLQRTKNTMRQGTFGIGGPDGLLVRVGWPSRLILKE